MDDESQKMRAYEDAVDITLAAVRGSGPEHQALENSGEVVNFFDGVYDHLRSVLHGMEER